MEPQPRVPTRALAAENSGDVSGGIVMKIRFASILIVAVFVSTLAIAGDGSWTGYIADGKCGATAAHEGAAECTATGVKEGAKLVLVNDADKKEYAVAYPAKEAAHAAQ